MSYRPTFQLSCPSNLCIETKHKPWSPSKCQGWNVIISSNGPTNCNGAEVHTKQSEQNANAMKGHSEVLPPPSTLRSGLTQHYQLTAAFPALGKAQRASLRGVILHHNPCSWPGSAVALARHFWTQLKDFWQCHEPPVPAAALAAVKSLQTLAELGGEVQSPSGASCQAH